MTEEKLLEIEWEIHKFIEGVLSGEPRVLPYDVVKDLADTAIACFRCLLCGDMEAARVESNRFYEKNGRYLYQ